MLSLSMQGYYLVALVEILGFIDSIMWFCYLIFIGSYHLEESI